MDPLDKLVVASPEPIFAASGSGPRRIAWHTMGVLLAAIVAWLIFTAYRQPDLMLDLAAMRLC